MCCTHVVTGMCLLPSVPFVFVLSQSRFDDVRDAWLKKLSIRSFQPSHGKVIVDTSGHRAAYARFGVSRTSQPHEHLGEYCWKRYLLSVVAERCSCEERKRDVAEETMSAMVKLAKEIDEPNDTGQPTAECHLMVLPPRRKLLTRRDKLRPRRWRKRHRGAFLDIENEAFKRRMATWTRPGP